MKMDAFKTAQKVTQELSKIAQSGHTAGSFLRLSLTFSSCFEYL